MTAMAEMKADESSERGEPKCITRKRNFPEDNQGIHLETTAQDAASSMASPSKRPIQCEHCPLRLSNRQGYLKHLGRRHPDKQLDQLCSAAKKWYNCEETDCDIRVRSREELLHHLGKDHGWEIKEVTGTFDNEDEFEIFFQRVQKMYKTRFVSRHGKVNGVKRFYCNREGAIRLKLEDRSRKHIRRGSSKIGTFCTAHAIVSYHTNGQVSIIGSVTHYNHELEGRYLPLLESEKNFIRYHAQMGMNCREILEILHKTVGELDEDDPLRYVDYKTIRNTLERGRTLEQSRAQAESARSQTDPGSVQMLSRINDHSRGSLRTETTQTKSLHEERARTTFSDIVLEHTAAVNGAFDIIQTDTYQWGVKRPEGKIRHRVIRVADVCPDEARLGTQCSLTCKLCQRCAHLYKCNCGGATKIGKMCKHVHAVVQYTNDYEPREEAGRGEGRKRQVSHEYVEEEYTVAQEVEEEHGLLDSYIDQTGVFEHEGAEVVVQKRETGERETPETLQAVDSVGGTATDGQVVAIIKGPHEVMKVPVETAEEGQGGVIYQTFEIIPSGAVLEASDAAEPSDAAADVVVLSEQRLNPEYELFLEQVTTGHNQLYQVANPENILQASTIFQQVKNLVLAAETPTIVKH